MPLLQELKVLFDRHKGKIGWDNKASPSYTLSTLSQCSTVEKCYSLVLLTHSCGAQVLHFEDEDLRELRVKGE